ncbi:MAG: hypothetical protein M3441_10360 [Chloroflexota bacterium]|nr:hypothetical protein [Chloroflexota bacterium]
MTEDMPRANSANPRRWHLFIALALCAGILLWFFYLSDYTLAGTLTDIIFPIVTLVLGFVGLRAAKGATTRRARRLARLVCLPAIVGGLLYIATGVLFVAFSPMGAMFSLYEIADEALIQSAPSPDGSRVAEVYFRGVGPYTGGNGRIFVRVKHTLFPLVERDVYATKTYEAGPNTTDYLSWTSNDTLYIPEANEIVSLGLIRGKMPDIVAVPLRLFEFMGWMAEQRQKEENAAAPLRDLPLYPGPITFDNSGGGILDANGYRAFSISTRSSDEAAEWYKLELSKAPWKLESSQRRESVEHAGADLHAVQVVYNCLEARKDLGGGQSRVYYWQIWWHDDMDKVRVMVETPERPGVWHCEEGSYP